MKENAVITQHLTHIEFFFIKQQLLEGEDEAWRKVNVI